MSEDSNVQSYFFPKRLLRRGLIEGCQIIFSGEYKKVMGIAPSKSSAKQQAVFAGMPHGLYGVIGVEALCFWTEDNYRLIGMKAIASRV